MATYYVGTGGNNSNDGTTWALRKLTLTGAEDIPVAAADTVYVGPGVYRETLTVDVSGTAGNIITYIGDVTGQNTDGVGGVVRITGSDNDTSATRTNCITASSKNYRTFRGFFCDTADGSAISLVSCTDVIIENFSIEQGTGSASINIAGADQSNTTIRRCIFLQHASNYAIRFTHSSTLNDTNALIENCIFLGGRGVSSERIGGIVISHCIVNGCNTGVRVVTALASGQTVTVRNSALVACTTALQATTTAEFVEDYNTIYASTTVRSNVSTGANSVTYPPLFSPPILSSGHKFPSWLFGSLSEWSALRAIAGTSMATDDLFGVTRPTTDSKKSWGPIQYQPVSRSTATKRTGAASIKLADAARHQMFVPTDGTEITIAAYAYWEADYAGDKPQLIVKQPGQSDSTDTATGAAANWEELTLTLTPAALPPYVVVELVSRNTATSGSYGTYFDDLIVT